MTTEHVENQLSLKFGSRGPDGWAILPFAADNIRMMRNFLEPQNAAELQALLTDRVNWRRDSVSLFGKQHPIPRLHQWYGDPDAVYRWSGITMQPQPWLDELSELREQLQVLLGCQFNSTLINYYRDGNDSMGWHADDEKELGALPVIASVSLGASREFLLRSRCRKSDRSTHCITLEHGSLLVMAGDSQQKWQHSLPRRLRVRSPRINLTFRQVDSATA
jgi:alkylated DNA repair dioxygenase AlkB